MTSRPQRTITKNCYTGCHSTTAERCNTDRIIRPESPAAPSAAKRDPQKLPSEVIQLEDNLVLRAATIDDAEQTIELNRFIHGNPEKNEPDDAVAAWTVDLFAGYNPLIGPSDFTVVEDTNTGKIVSTICLM